MSDDSRTEVSPIPRHETFPRATEFFDDSGALTDVGLEAWERTMNILVKHGVDNDQLFGAFQLWRYNQWMEKEQPGYLQTLGSV